MQAGVKSCLFMTTNSHKNDHSHHVFVIVKDIDRSHQCPDGILFLVMCENIDFLVNQFHNTISAIQRGCFDQQTTKFNHLAIRKKACTSLQILLEHYNESELLEMDQSEYLCLLFSFTQKQLKPMQDILQFHE